MALRFHCRLRDPQGIGITSARTSLSDILCRSAMRLTICPNTDPINLVVTSRCASVYFFSVIRGDKGIHGTWELNNLRGSFKIWPAAHGNGDDDAEKDQFKGLCRQERDLPSTQRLALDSRK